MTGDKPVVVKVPKSVLDGIKLIPLNKDTLDAVLDEVRAERGSQERKWGPQNHDDFPWLSILVEEVGEAAMAVNEANFEGGSNYGNYADLRAELVQCAAVCIAWVEAIDRRSDSGE